jgi:hypothetical protein
MTINGKEVHLRAGMLCVEIFLSKTLNTQSLAGGAFGVSSILWGGIVNYYDVKELTRPVTFEELYNAIENQLLDGDDIKEAQDFVKEFEDSLAWKKQVEKVEEMSEEIKKKLATEKLPTSADLDQVSTNG